MLSPLMHKVAKMWRRTPLYYVTILATSCIKGLSRLFHSITCKRRLITVYILAYLGYV